MKFDFFHYEQRGRQQPLITIRALLLMASLFFLFSFVSADSFGYDSTKTIIQGSINSTTNLYQNITNINQTTINNGGNVSFNQTLTDSLYSSSIWGYNQTGAAVNNNSLGVNNSQLLQGNTPQQVANLFSSVYLYNQSLALINLFGQLWYNQTSPAIAYADTKVSNSTFNQTLTDTLYANIQWNYNQTTGAITYASDINTSLTSKINSLSFSGNSTFNQSLTDSLYANIQWNYNQTTGFANWLASFLYNYNQTTPAIAYANTKISNSTFNQSLTDTLYSSIIWNYNQSTASFNAYGNYWINQTTGAISYASDINTSLTSRINSVTQNTTFNQSLTDTLYSSYIWGYNQTGAAVNNNSLGVNNSQLLQGKTPQQVANLFSSVYLYNQTIPANAYADTKLTQTMADLLYAERDWGYNQTSPAIAYTDAQIATVTQNKTFNQTLTDTLYAGIAYNYNQTTGAITYTDSKTNSTFNQSLTDSLYASKGVGNSTFNQTLTDTLYANIQWNYNQTTGFSNWLNAFLYNYNQTTGAITYTSDINTSLTSRINSLTGNSTFNQSLTDLLYSSITWNYNQTTGFSNWLATFLYNYNQTTPANTYASSVNSSLTTRINSLTGNSTFNQSLTDLLYSPIKWNYNQTYSGSTYNATYALWAYNQTISSSSNGNSTFNQSLTDLLYSSITWNYNQTTPAITYTNSKTNSTFNQTLTDSLYGSSAVSFTNVAYTNNSNTFTAPQNFTSNVTIASIIKMYYTTGACDLTLVHSYCANLTGTYIIG